MLQPLANRLAACLRAGFGVQLCPPPLPSATTILAHPWSIMRVPKTRRRDLLCQRAGYYLAIIQLTDTDWECCSIISWLIKQQKADATPKKCLPEQLAERMWWLLSRLVLIYFLLERRQWDTSIIACLWKMVTLEVFLAFLFYFKLWCYTTSMPEASKISLGEWEEKKGSKSGKQKEGKSSEFYYKVLVMLN